MLQWDSSPVRCGTKIDNLVFTLANVLRLEKIVSNRNKVGIAGTKCGNHCNLLQDNRAVQVIHIGDNVQFAGKQELLAMCLTCWRLGIQ